MLLAAGCELKRPKGNFDPNYDSGIDQPVDAAALPMLEASVSFFQDATIAEDGGIVVPPPSDPRLAELVGAYLVRVDDYSTAATTVNAPIPTDVEVRNRTSYLLVASISEREGALVWSERACGEAHQQTCQAGCSTSGTSTTVRGEVSRFFDTVMPTERRVTLQDDGTLKADPHTLYLGFDAREDSALPASNSDGRVWDTMSSISGHEGVYTEVKMKVNLLSAQCNVSIVQQLTTEWTAPLTMQGEAYVLGGAADVPVNLAGTTSKILLARGVAPATDADCSGEGASGDTVQQVISFAKVPLSEITSCPRLARFDQLLPAAPP